MILTKIIEIVNMNIVRVKMMILLKMRLMVRTVIVHELKPAATSPCPLYTVSATLHTTAATLGQAQLRG